MDVGNRRKLLEDCIATAIGIDDLHYFNVSLIKRIDTELPFSLAEIVLLRVDPQTYGIPLEYLNYS